jgi:hypothetical protein
MNYPISPVVSYPAFPAQADPLLKTTLALPAAGAANAHASIDLGQPGTLWPSSQKLAFQLQIPALPSLPDTKKGTFTVKHSADNVTFSAIYELSTVFSTGAGGVGAAAQTVTLPLPGSTLRYIRLDQAVDAAGGDNTAVTVVAQLLVQI